MSVVTLPDSPGPRSLKWSQFDPGGVQEGALGGSDQRVNKLGIRWRCEVELPAMTTADARKWFAALTRGLRNGVSMEIRQVETPTGAPGAVLVNGADQAGDALIVDGGTPGYQAQAGQWLSLLTGGKRYLYMVQEAGQLDETGAATLQIEPPLRAIPADDDPVDLAAPVIEGLIETPEWSISVDRLVRGFSFMIMEAR